jgi:hypothetical protein
MTRRLVVLVAVPAVLMTMLVPAAGAAPRLLRLDGIGPLKLGMSRSAALATGWLTDRQPGCELAGDPRPFGYRLAGPRAPTGVRGIATLRSGRLISLSLTRGVRTRLGVTVGVTSRTTMVRRYRRAGFAVSSRFDPAIGARFVTIRRGGSQKLVGLARGGIVRQLGIPSIPICE